MAQGGGARAPRHGCLVRARGRPGAGGARPRSDPRNRARARVRDPGPPAGHQRAWPIARRARSRPSAGGRSGWSGCNRRVRCLARAPPGRRDRAGGKGDHPEPRRARGGVTGARRCRASRGPLPDRPDPRLSRPRPFQRGARAARREPPFPELGAAPQRDPRRHALGRAGDGAERPRDGPQDADPRLYRAVRGISRGDRSRSSRRQVPAPGDQDAHVGGHHARGGPSDTPHPPRRVAERGLLSRGSGLRVRQRFGAPRLDRVRTCPRRGIPGREAHADRRDPSRGRSPHHLPGVVLPSYRSLSGRRPAHQRRLRPRAGGRAGLPPPARAAEGRIGWRRGPAKGSAWGERVGVPAHAGRSHPRSGKERRVRTLAAGRSRTTRGASTSGTVSGFQGAVRTTW